MTQKNLYIWFCDLSKFTGEGNLGRLFIKNKLKKYNILYIPNKFDLSFLNHKYVSPFIGIFFCWKHYFNKQKVCYLNYLPLWNIFLFLFLPPKTILGPITGGAKFKKEKTFEFFLREYVFSIFYYLSNLLLILRKCNVYFSTSLLKKYLSKKLIDKSKFDFFTHGILEKPKIKTSKDFHFIIYYKKHKNKMNMYPIQLIKKLIMFKYKILVIGDRFNMSGVINYGYLDRIKLTNILMKTKFCISSNENLSNFFVIDCINNNVKIITTEKKIELNKLISKHVIHINSKNISKHICQKLLDT